MNKRFYFILIPVLALLFNWNSRAGNHISLNKPYPGSFVTIKTEQNNFPKSERLRKENSERIKYKIRTKAWDDAPGVLIGGEEIPGTIFCFYSELAYWGYNFSFRSYHLSKHSLRGPPVA